MPHPGAPKFAADVMLGSLARWLRILGFDVAYDNQIDDDTLIELSLRERRRVLTQDRLLAARRGAADSLLVKSQVLEEQIREVLEWVDSTLSELRPLSRCVECNALLGDVAPEEIEEEVPPYVFQTQEVFKRCPSCRKVFWAGTHRSQMLRRLRRLFKEEAGRPGEPPAS